MVVMISGTTNGYSQDGSDAVSNEIIIGGFAKNTMAHIVLIGWTFSFPSGDTPICQMYLYLQQPITGSWQNAQDIMIQNDGTVHARYYVGIGSQNRNNPFNFMITFLVIGEEPTT